ncbi:hypothetical protein Lal_00047950 [Lupinus albus]|nr:hypothetical protein Lal_00047950 [Lupinus albus]
MHTSEHKHVISSTRTLPSLGIGHKIHNLPLPRVIIITNLLPEHPFGYTQLQFSTESSKEGNKYNICITCIKNTFCKGPSSHLRRSHKIPHDPVLRTVLLDQWVVRGFGNVGGSDFKVSVTAETGIGVEGPITVEEVVVEGSGKVGDIDIDGGRRWKRERGV